MLLREPSSSPTIIFALCSSEVGTLSMVRNGVGFGRTYQISSFERPHVGVGESTLVQISKIRTPFSNWVISIRSSACVSEMLSQSGSAKIVYAIGAAVDTVTEYAGY